MKIPCRTAVTCRNHSPRFQIAIREDPVDKVHWRSRRERSGHLGGASRGSWAWIMGLPSLFPLVFFLFAEVAVLAEGVVAAAFMYRVY